MITLDEARTFVLEACGPRPTIRVALPDALGCVAVDGLVATESVPPFANTAVDGFAVRAADTAGATEATPVRFDVIGTIRAGMAPGFEPGPGQAVRIMTGAPMPAGADAVVMVEDSAPVDDGSGSAPEGSVALSAEVGPGAHVRPAGDDLRPGDLVFPPGDLVTVGHLGVLATFGVTHLDVVPRPRVGVFSTGDELVEGPQPLRPGQIRDSNRRTLLALVEQAGCIGIDLGRIADDEDAITAAIELGAATCDALVSSGGVSMGDFDFVKVVLDRIGDMRWMQVAIKPAKPLAFGTVPGPVPAGGGAVPRIPVFGLPGNPVSSVVSFELFARPGLRSMMGRSPADLDRPRVRAVSDEPLRRARDGKIHFARVICAIGEDGRFHVRSAGGQGSHQLSALVGANALAVLPDGDALERGAELDVLLTDLGA